MARLTNEEIRRMSLDEADAYTDAHPATYYSQDWVRPSHSGKIGRAHV